MRLERKGITLLLGWGLVAAGLAVKGAINEIRRESKVGNLPPDHYMVGPGTTVYYSKSSGYYMKDYVGAPTGAIVKTDTMQPIYDLPVDAREVDLPHLTVKG